MVCAFYLEVKRKAFFNPFSRHPFYLYFFKEKKEKDVTAVGAMKQSIGFF